MVEALLIKWRKSIGLVLTLFFILAVYKLFKGLENIKKYFVPVLGQSL